jgi:formylglycine-generating enzyme
MSMLLTRLSFVLSLLIASSASAVTMDWTFVGNPGNPADSEVMTCCNESVGTSGYGSVPYAYNIGTYEVTNEQYAEFLNAKAKSDPYDLYDPAMAAGWFSGGGGITRSGSSGNYTYSVISYLGNMPVNWVSHYDAFRFANWMNNGQGDGDTETGAYTLLGGTAIPSNGTTVTRNAGATMFLPSENEWYKAAYYDSSTASYFDYPTGTDTQPTCSAPTASPNSANCDYAYDGHVAYVGSYSGSRSPYGTFDQGGNVWEFNDSLSGTSERSLRGGSDGYYNPPSTLAAWYREVGTSGSGTPLIGIRLAMIPEPSSGLLVIVGLISLAARRKLSA